MSVLSPDRERFLQHGWCVLRKALSEIDHQLLLAECEAAIAYIEERMADSGNDVIDGNRRHLQYFPENRHVNRPKLRGFLIGDFMHQLASGLLGEPVNLFWEQFAIKLGDRDGGAGFVIDDGPSSLGEFSWHQDSGYVPFDHEPYLSCWIALDDVTAKNGALRLIPYEMIGIRTRVQHRSSPTNGDLVGYFGGIEGLTIPMPARSILCFSSTVFHASGRNVTQGPRRAYLAQYSRGVIQDPTGSRPWGGTLRVGPAADE